MLLAIDEKRKECIVRFSLEMHLQIASQRPHDGLERWDNFDSNQEGCSELRKNRSARVFRGQLTLGV